MPACACFADGPPIFGNLGARRTLATQIQTG